jgi:hypothetical protein
LDALDDIRKKFERWKEDQIDEEYKVGDGVFFSIMGEGYRNRPFHLELDQVREHMKIMGQKKLFESFNFKVVRIRYDGHRHTNLVLPSSSKTLLKKVLAGGR